MSENKAGKYIKYAIGEIILVVLGILIALQINNWNENRKDRTLETQYLNRLRVDLEFDQSWLDLYLINRYDRKKEGLKKGKAYFQDNLVVKDTLQFLNDIGYGGVFGHASWGLNKNSYNELISTGNLIKIESDSLRTKIINYYENSNSIANSSKNYVTGYIGFTNSFTAFDTDNPNLIEKFDQELFLKNIKTIEYYRLANEELTLAHRLVSWAKEIKTDAKELIALIDKQLND